ncbi:dienelactone hydrolase family protein [Lactiplantibacillus sp. WILCCON 0030]|uniref:Dienelactone hydrolase family protein n=1 Tax=Lactiplantibacillus brownii TaxID=3069269 RepID=A0ABU1AAK5_9LACO|nr:dienelactone hydrolase family protein [Lactiplantibacillus brownii]MDQ7937945.1 dienelactone hydrolase family protein [Lactiplantibacillus brownii]
MTTTVFEDVIVRTTKLDDLPVLHVFAASQAQTKLPTIIDYHGWTTPTSSELVASYQLVEAGFRVILPTAYLHGSRNDGTDLDRHPEHFWEIVGHSVAEFPRLVDALVTRGLTDPDKIGVMGTSMGGITAAGVMATQANVQAGVSLIGSPEPVAFAKDQVAQIPAALLAQLPADLLKKTYAQIGQFDLSQHIEQLAGRPMFFFNGTADTMVPYKYVEDFEQRFGETAALKHTIFQHADGGMHHVPHKMHQAAVAFLQRNIIG